MIDIERLRRQRAANTTTALAESETAGDAPAAETSGRPAASSPAETSAPPATADAAGLEAAGASGSAHAPVPPPVTRVAVTRRVNQRRGWKSSLTQPPIFVGLICVAVLLTVGAALLFRDPPPPATTTSAPPAEEDAAETVGRTLAPEETVAPRAQAVAAPRTAAEFYQSGSYHFSVRDFDAAVRDLRRAVELQPEFPSAHNRLGRALLYKGQLKAAEESFRTAARQRGGDYPTALYNLGFTLHQQRDAEGAIAAYREAIERRGGTYPDAFFQIGEIYFELPTRLPEAAEAYRKAIEQNGGRDPEAHFKLGVTLARANDPAGAEKAFRTAIEQRGGDFAYAHFNLGLLYQQTGRAADAVREFETYLQQAPPRDENRRRAENTLRDLRRRAESEQRNEGNRQQ